MTVIRPADISRFLEAGCREVPLILLYGPDEGGVRMRSRKVLQTLLGDAPEAMNRIDLDAETLASDPGRLLDEANAIGMFGGRRAIVVSQAGRLSKTAWQGLVDVPPLDSTVIFLADDLAKTAPLRVAMEQGAHAAAIACYAPGRADIQTLIDSATRAAGLSITPVARAYLAESLGSDYALAAEEIEKLVLYCRGALAIDVADIDAMITDTSELSASEPIDRAFEGKLDEIEAVALRSFREGINPSGTLVMALNHAFLLRKLVLARAHGALDDALRKERVFFRRQDRVRQQVSIWEVSGLSRCIETLSTAQDQSRRTAAMEETITIRALWSIALAARRR